MKTASRFRGLSACSPGNTSQSAAVHRPLVTPGPKEMRVKQIKHHAKVEVTQKIKMLTITWSSTECSQTLPVMHGLFMYVPHLHWIKGLYSLYTSKNRSSVHIANKQALTHRNSPQACGVFCTLELQNSGTGGGKTSALQITKNFAQM